MSVAWATIIIVAMLLPGAGFLAGLAIKDRFSQDIIKTGALGEVALALFISIALHLAAYVLANLVGLGGLMRQRVRQGVFDYVGPHEFPGALEGFIAFGAGYSIVMAAAAFGLGAWTASLVRRGYLKLLSRYPWTNELQNDSDGLIKVYIVTKTVANNQVLMYEGALSEFYLDQRGCFTYIVINECSRYFMDFNAPFPVVGQQLSLFKSDLAEGRKWNYLTIQGDNIANVLFEKIGKLDESQSGRQKVEDALKEVDKAG